VEQERTTRSFWVRAPGEGTLLSEPLPRLRSGDVCVEALYSGISRGTESLVFRGAVPPTQYHDMRAPFQEGDFPGPVKYGYASVGRVVRVGSDTHRAWMDRTVFCLFPHQERYVVGVEALVEVPQGVDPARAVLAANLETAVNVVWDARVSVGDRVVVVGAGVVGLLVSWLCAGVPGTRVLAVDPNPARSGAARALGVSLVEEAPRGVDADVVVHASGTSAGAVAALEAAGVEGRVIEASWFGDRVVPLPLGEAFHSRRLTLRSSQVGRIPPDRAPRWSHRRRLEVALGLLRDDRLDVLIDGESPFEVLPEVMHRLATAPDGGLCHRIRYGPGESAP